MGMIVMHNFLTRSFDDCSHSTNQTHPEKSSFLDDRLSTITEEPSIYNRFFSFSYPSVGYSRENLSQRSNETSSVALHFSEDTGYGSKNSWTSRFNEIKENT